MKYKNIPDLYLIKGKLVFRKHIVINGQELNIWKTIGQPDEFTEEELRKIVADLKRKFYETRVFALKNGNSNEKDAEVCTREKSELKKKTENDRTETRYHSNSKKYQQDSLHSDKTESAVSPTLGEILDRFFNWHKFIWNPSTYKREVNRAKNLLRFFGKDFPLLRIGTGEVEAFKIERLKEGASLSTVNKDLRLLSTVINRSVELEWIPHHKLYKKPLLIKGVKDERIRYLTEDEEKRLIHALDRSKNEVLKDIVLFALHTGLRLGEILNLKWENVNLKNKIVVLFPEQTKSKRRHILPLNEVAFKVLEKRSRCRVQGCPYVFHKEGEKIGSIRKAFRNALRRAKIEDFRFHDLRHTFASRLVQKNVDLYIVKELLNHSDIRTTQRYAHLKLDNLKKAVEVLKIQE